MRGSFTEQQSSPRTRLKLTQDSQNPLSNPDAHSGNIRNKNSDGTRLSAHIWKIKDDNLQYSLKWNVIDISSAYNQTTGQCRLCLKEKWYIMFRPEGAT